MEQKTRVIHVRDWNRNDPNYVYIGRAVPRKGIKASPWANPFKIGDTHPAVGCRMEREDAIIAFKEWVEYSSDPRAVWIREHVHELRGKTLVCWCKPEDCHGDTLAEMADAPVAA